MYTVGIKLFITTTHTLAYTSSGFLQSFIGTEPLTMEKGRVDGPEDKGIPRWELQYYRSQLTSRGT